MWGFGQALKLCCSFSVSVYLCCGWVCGQRNRYRLLPLMVKDVPYNIDDTVKRIMSSSKLPKKLDVDSYYALAGYTCVSDNLRVRARLGNWGHNQ